MMIVSSLPAILADRALPTILLWLAPPVCIVLGAGIGVFWQAQMQRQHASPETVILLCSPRSRPLIIPTVILLICSTTLLFVSLDRTGKDVVVTAGFSSFIFACDRLRNLFVIFLADGVGLTRTILCFSKTLPWATIDWIYVQQTHEAYRTSLRTFVAEYRLIVEAGPQQRVKVPLQLRRIRWTRVQPDTLRHTIQERATKALVGYHHQQEVHQRRAGKTPLQPHHARRR